MRLPSASSLAPKGRPVPRKATGLGFKVRTPLGPCRASKTSPYLSSMSNVPLGPIVTDSAGQTCLYQAVARAHNLFQVLQTHLLSTCSQAPTHNSCPLTMMRSSSVRHILRLTGLFLVALVMISGAAPYWLAAGSSTLLWTLLWYSLTWLARRGDCSLCDKSDAQSLLLLCAHAACEGELGYT